MKATYVDGIMFLKSENYEDRFYIDYSKFVYMLERFGYHRCTSSNRRGYIKRAKDKK